MTTLEGGTESARSSGKQREIEDGYEAVAKNARRIVDIGNRFSSASFRTVRCCLFSEAEDFLSVSAHHLLPPNAESSICLYDLSFVRKMCHVAL